MVKVHDKVTFPFVLNMNDYLNGYDGIKNKVSEKEIEKQKNRGPFEYQKGERGVAFEIKLQESMSVQNDSVSKGDSGDAANPLKISSTTQATDDVLMTDESAKSSPVRTNSAGSVGGDKLNGRP